MNKNKIYALMIFSFFSFISSIFFTNCAPSNQQDQAQEATSSSGEATSGNPELGSEFSGKVQGTIGSISTSGSIWGYAYDPNNKTKSMRVYFYVDGPVGTGKLIGNSLANIQSLGINAGHYYSFTIPATYADGKPHKIYAYGHAATVSFSLTPTSFAYTAFTPKAENIYNQGINNLVTSTCNKCHSWNFKDLYYGALLSPTPAQGGTATNNKFIQKMQGHGGGKYCNALTDFPCSDIQAWWNAEFM